MIKKKINKIFSKVIFISFCLLIIPQICLSVDAFSLALQGQELIQKKNYPKAVITLKKAVKIDPQNDWAYGLLGRAYFKLDKKADAIKAFRKAVSINPDDTFSRMMIDEISQKPIPRINKNKKKFSLLEKEAIREEKLMQESFSANKDLTYKVKTVVIDPGHGGFDNGAVGLNGLKEKDVVLNLAYKLHNRLTHGRKVKSFLTRTSDYYVPLSTRTAFANQHNADLFISLHINASTNRKASGSETYFCSEKASNAEARRVAVYENSVLKYDKTKSKKNNLIDLDDMLTKIEQKMYWNESGKFAGIFQKQFTTDLPFKSRGVNSANFYVLRRAKMPAILLETGFISNPENETILSYEKNIEDIARAIEKGLIYHEYKF